MLDGATPQEIINLQTLVAAIQNAVQAQNLVATRIQQLTTAFGIAFPAPLTSSLTWNPPSIASGAQATNTVTVAGAVLGNYVSVKAGVDLQGLILSGYVSATNTVTIVLANLTGGAVDLGSAIFTARVTTV